MDSQIKENLTLLIGELLAKMDLAGQILIDDSQPEFLLVKIDSDEAGLLIGQGGENLLALQHLARCLFNKKNTTLPVSFILDVNDYRAHRLELIRSMALSFARQVVEDQRPRTLEPMSSYERRLVHLTLSKQSGIKTESQGEGEERRIVIKPADSSN